MKQQDIYNIIVAAGRGSRFGAEIPKQFCLLDNRPVLMHTIERMRNTMPDSHIIIVLSKDFVEYWLDLCKKHDFSSPEIAIGGDTRWQSVKNALEKITGKLNDNSVITVHDGARPVINGALIDRVIDGCINADGAIPAIPVTDSLRLIGENGKSAPVDRSLYRAVQTPQAFRAEKLIAAYSLPYQHDFTDDASVMAAAGYGNIILVDGDARNIKITMPDDLAIAAIYLNQQ